MALITASWIYDILLVLIGLLTIFYVYCTARYNHWKKKGIPYMKPAPFIGNIAEALTLKKCFAEFFRDCYNATTGPIIGLFIFHKPYLLIRDPSLIKAVLVKDFNYFSNRSHAHANDKDILGTLNIFSIENPYWKTLRAKLTPIFTAGRLKTMVPLLVEVGQKLNNHLKEIAEKQTVEMKETSARYSTDVIASLAFGVEANSFKDKNPEFWNMGVKIFTFTVQRNFEIASYFFLPFFVKLFGIQFFGKEGSRYLRSVYDSSTKYRRETGMQRNDLIDMLEKIRQQGSVDKEETEEKKPNDIKITDDMLAAQPAVFFGAGYETSSSAMTFTLHHLALHPDIQERLRDEINTVLAENNGEITYEVIKSMKYLEMCVRETIRLYPTLPFLDRMCERDYVLPGTGVKIEKGTPIIISLFALHRDPKYFPNPLEYNPERFNEENIKNIVPFSYMPFGEGPRNCIGERFGLIQVKIGLIHILKDFEVSYEKEVDETLKLDPKAFFMAPLNKIELKLKKIH